MIRAIKTWWRARQIEKKIAAADFKIRPQSAWAIEVEQNEKLGCCRVTYLGDGQVGKRAWQVRKAILEAESSLARQRRTNEAIDRWLKS